MTDNQQPITPDEEEAIKEVPVSVFTQISTSWMILLRYKEVRRGSGNIFLF